MSSDLSQQQILQDVHNDAMDALDVNIAGGSVELDEQAVAADGGALPALVKVAGGYDGTNVQVLKTDVEGELQIDVLSSALPAGAATEAKQDDANTSLASIDGKIVHVDTDDVSITSSALPAGAATEAKQDDIITEINTVGGYVNNFAAKTAAGLVPESHDTIQLTYVPSGNGVGEIQSVTYKTGGPSGTTLATLTLSYNGDNKLETVTRYAGEG